LFDRQADPAASHGFAGLSVTCVTPVDGPRRRPPARRPSARTLILLAQTLAHGDRVQQMRRLAERQVEWTPARIEACRKLVAEAMECGDPLLLSVGMQLALALSEIERLRMIRPQCPGK
jgi:hypothetical protein